MDLERFLLLRFIVEKIRNFFAVSEFSVREAFPNIESTAANLML